MISKQRPNKKEGKNKSLTNGMMKNTFYNVFSSIVGRLGGLVFTVILARALLPEIFGVYSLVLSTVLLFLTAIDSGINGSIIKYVSEAYNKRDTKKARTYFRFWFVFKLLISLSVSLLLLMFAKPIAVYIFSKPLLEKPLQVGALYLFSSSILTSLVSLSYSVKRVRYVLMQESILQTLKIAFIATLIILLKYSSIPLVFFVLFIVSSLSVIFLFALLKKNYSVLFKGELAKIDRRRLFRFFSFLAVTGIASSIFVHIDSVILGILIDSTKFVAFYLVALTIVQSATILVTFSSNVFLPFFTQLKGKALKEEFKRVFSYAFVLSAPAATGLIFVAPAFIRAVFGEEYLPSVLPLTILSFIVIETAAGSLFCAIFLAKEKPQYQMNVFIATSIFYVILSFVVIKALATINPSYSIIGAAIATLVSRYLAFFSLGIIAHRKFGISADFKKIFKALIASFAMLLFLKIFDKLFDFRFEIIAEVLLAIVFYAAFMWVIKGIKREDIDVLKGILQR